MYRIRRAGSLQITQVIFLLIFKVINRYKSFVTFFLSLIIFKYLAMSFATKFRNEQGVYYTKGLFYEQTLSDKSSVVYTLKDQDHEGFPSLYRLYMECEDLTEWEFANAYTGGWGHWQQLCECSWFKPYIRRWREELELKIRAAALHRIKAEARSNSRNSYTANKFLVDGGWKTKEETKNTRGRPSKEEVRRAAKHLAQDQELLDEDYKRINLN